MGQGSSAMARPSMEAAMGPAIQRIATVLLLPMRTAEFSSMNRRIHNLFLACVSSAKFLYNAALTSNQYSIR